MRDSRSFEQSLADIAPPIFYARIASLILAILNQVILLTGMHISYGNLIAKWSRIFRSK